MQRQTLMQQAFGLEQLRVALGKYDGDANRVLEYYKAVLDSEVEEAKIVGSATTDLVKQQREGGKNANKGAAPGGSNTTENEPAITGTDEAA